MSDYGVTLQPDCLWKKHDAINNGQKCDLSGLQYSISNAARDDYREQFKQAAAFLSANKQWLQVLIKDPRVEQGFVDFGLRQDSHPAYYRRIPLVLIQ